MKRSFLACLLLTLFLIASNVFALEVDQVRWGFDGHVVPGRFNLLSVLVSNPSGKPFDGAITLHRNRGFERVGALYVTPCYVSPQISRWVQFYVYIDNQHDEWHLEWGRGADAKQELKTPPLSVPAQVLLSDLEPTLTTSSAFKQFPEELFPPTAAATAGLGSVVLDHVPRWEPAKRHAFLNWLRAGGELHLLRGEDGRVPVFADDLSVLNTTSDRTRIGSGLIVRHAATIREIRKQDIENRTVEKKQAEGESPTLSQTSEYFFRNLAYMSRPHYHWSLIYLLAIGYLALVGPGNLLIGRKLGDYRLRIALLLATVAGFTFLFNFVGRRGQGEASVIHTFSYAQSVGNGSYEVTQWINAFATRSGRYNITHPAPHNIYSTGQDYESVNGVIESGKDGRFTVEIPMYSRRALLHQAEMKGPEIPLKIVNWEGGANLKKLAVNVPANFAGQVMEGWAVQGDQMFPLNISNGQLQFENPRELKDMLSGVIDYGFEDQNVDLDTKNKFQKLVKPAIAWSLGIEDVSRPEASFRPKDGRVELFLFARSPESFGIAGSQFGSEVGFVLYHFQLFSPES